MFNNNNSSYLNLQYPNQVYLVKFLFWQNNFNRWQSSSTTSFQINNLFICKFV